MKHKLGYRKLSRASDARQSLLINLVKEIIIHKRIKTTLHKAKEASKLYDKIISKCKVHNFDFNGMRLIIKKLRLYNDKNKIIDNLKDINESCKTRCGGYTRIKKFQFNKHSVQMVLWSIVDNK